MKQKLTLLFLICILSALKINAGVYEGSCGTNVKYSLDTSTGVLKITGTGPMANNNAPWYSNRSYIKTVEISNSVTSIGDDAFLECTGLTSVTIPNSVTSIGERAFDFCTSLTSVTIPNSVTSIGRYAFRDCYGLTSITIGNSVTSIGNGAFSGCSGLTSVTIGNSVTSIGEYAFRDCSKLTSVTIPNSVTSIGYYAFYGCYFEKKDFINNSSLDVEANNYWGATIIDSRNDGFVIKDGTLLKYTGNDASVTIPNSVTSIGNSAFYYCSKLTSVTIPNSVTSIGGEAFRDCYGLTSVTIPNSVTSIGEEAFLGCSGLTSVTIPNSVTSIGNYAFSGCSGLTSVTIGNSVTNIGYNAFNGADIPTVVSLIENPFTIEGKTSSARTFTQNTFNNATLYVPKGTIEKYKATDGWKDFLFIEEGEGPGGDTPETQKCATPTISYENGKLTFDCETEGVEYVSSITPPSAFNSGSKTVSMPTTYKVTVYATKDGYENSDVATKDINVSGGTSGLRGDVNNDGTVNMPDAMFIVNKILNGKFPDEK